MHRLRHLCEGDGGRGLWHRFELKLIDAVGCMDGVHGYTGINETEKIESERDETDEMCERPEVGRSRPPTIRLSCITRYMHFSGSRSGGGGGSSSSKQ